DRGCRIERDFHEAIAVRAVDRKTLRVEVARGGVERAIAGFEIEETLRIDRGNSAALPDSTEPAVGRRVERARDGERVRVERDQPAVIRTVIAVARPRRVNLAVVKHQAR